MGRPFERVRRCARVASAGAGRKGAYLRLGEERHISFDRQNLENTFFISFSMCAATLFSAIPNELG
jgi:hypothetical protein